MKTEPAMNEITLPLDERNLAHVLTALALAGIADSLDSAHPDSRCWWAENGFKLRIPQTKAELFAEAHDFAKSIVWVEGIGSNEKHEVKASPHHGLFTANAGHSGNPLLSYHDQGITPSVFKTFAGQQCPATPLQRQRDALKSPNEVSDWLFQPGFGVASWKFDSRTARHAYDQGFGSNEDQSPERDPFYPAVELLSIAGAAFFAHPQSWLTDINTLHCRMWDAPLPLNLAPLAVIFQVPSSIDLAKLDRAKLLRTLEDACLINGVGGRFYAFSRRGNTYGTGERKYRHFPEASLINQSTSHQTP